MDVRAITRIVGRVIAPLAQRVRLSVSRGVVEVVNDALKCQGLQVSLLSDELRDDVERFQEYGFTSVPFADGNAEVLALTVGGNRSHVIVACVSDRTRRPKDLTEGDVCLFTDKGERVYLNTTEDVVHLGAKAAAEFVALSTKTDTRISDLETKVNNHITWANAHIHPLIIAAMVGAGGTGTSTPPVPPDTALAPGASTAATRVKAT